MAVSGDQAALHIPRPKERTEYIQLGYSCLANGERRQLRSAYLRWQSQMVRGLLCSKRLREAGARRNSRLNPATWLELASELGGASCKMPIARRKRPVSSPVAPAGTGL